MQQDANDSRCNSIVYVDHYWTLKCEARSTDKDIIEGWHYLHRHTRAIAGESFLINWTSVPVRCPARYFEEDRTWACKLDHQHAGWHESDMPTSSLAHITGPGGRKWRTQE